MTDDEKAQAVLEMLTPGRTWFYLDQAGPDNSDAVKRVITDREILRDYFPYWCDQMHRALKSDEINEESCIQDFVTVHWAWQVD